MSTVQEIQKAVENLSREELLEFRDWFAQFEAALGDKTIEEDAAAGKLDRLAQEALRDFTEGRTRPL